MSKIQHIIYVMFENRSFDSVLGWLYPTPQDGPSNFMPAGTEPVFNGLQTGNYFNPKGDGTNIYVSQIPISAGQQIPSMDPNEEFQSVHNQIYGQGSQEPNMLGFYEDFASEWFSTPEQIMQCYTPESLPVLNGLAKSYAVSDAYFSSIPTQTNCNRAFAMTGNSIGVADNTGPLTAWVNNNWQDIYELNVDFNQRTIWNVLEENGFGTTNDWMVYYSDLWPSKYLGNYCFTQDLFWPTTQNQSANFTSIDNFFKILADDNAILPKFSFLEPTWFEEVWNGCDYHPPANVSYGEIFLNSIVTQLQASNKWENTLLIINFDEHGGTYDHVIPPGITAPWYDSQNGTPLPESYECGFDFQQLGVRVPLILVSPYIQEGTVFRSPAAPYDHTSVIASVLEFFGIDRMTWNLGTRTANAETFLDVLTLSTPREDLVKLSPIEQQPPDIAPINSEPNDLQMMIAHRAIVRKAQLHEYPQEGLKALHNRYFSDGIKTMGHLNEVLQAIKAEIESHDVA